MNNLENKIDIVSDFRGLDLSELSRWSDDLKKDLSSIGFNEGVRNEEEEYKDLKVDDKSHLKQFTRDLRKTERKKLATELWNERKDKLRSQLELEKQEENISEQVNKLTEIVLKSNNLDQRLEKNKEFLLKRFYYFFENRRINNDLNKNKILSTRLEGEIAENREIVASILEIKKEEKKLQREKIREKIKEFLQNEIPNWREYERKQDIQKKITLIEEYLFDQRESDVKFAMEDNNVFFVHGVLPFYSVEGNSLLNEWADWKIKLKVMLSFNPTISASSVKEGDNADNVWSQIGVLIGEGKIKSAFWGDAVTLAKSITKRVANHQTMGNIRTQIKDAIERRNNYHYNEFTISKPEVAGIYIYFLQGEESVYHINCAVNGGIKKKLDIGEVYRFAQETNLPLCIIRDGQLYRSKYEDFQLKLGEKVDRKEVFAKGKGKVDEVRRSEYLKEIFQDSPFRLGSQEISDIGLRQEGREIFDQYFLFNDPFYYYPGFAEKEYYLNNEHISDQIVREHDVMDQYRHTYLRSDKSTGQYVQDRYFRTTEIFIHKEPTIGGEIFYYYNGRSLKAVKKIKNIDVEKYSYSIDKQKIFDNYTLGITDFNGGPIEFVEEVKKKLKEFADKAVADDRYKNICRKGVFMLHGFAERAKEFGQEEIFQKALEVAQPYIDIEEYFDIVHRRIDDKCRIKIMPEDLNM